MIIESNKAQINNSAQKTFEFVSNSENFPKLLPEEKVVVKEVSNNHIVFEIQGMATISMKVSEVADNVVKVISEGKNPFDFKMEIKVNEISENKSEAYLVFNGDVNSFLKMMVEKPLTNFFNALSAKLEETEI